MCLRDCTPLHVWQIKVRPPTEQVAKLDMLLQEAALDTTRPQCGSVGLEVGAVVTEALLQREIWLHVTERGLCGQCPCFFL